MGPSYPRAFRLDSNHPSGSSPSPAGTNSKPSSSPLAVLDVDVDDQSTMASKSARTRAASCPAQAELPVSIVNPRLGAPTSARARPGWAIVDQSPVILDTQRHAQHAGQRAGLAQSATMPCLLRAMPGDIAYKGPHDGDLISEAARQVVIKRAISASRAASAPASVAVLSAKSR